MADFIDPEWEYHVPDPEIAEILGPSHIREDFISELKDPTTGKFVSGRGGSFSSQGEIDIFSILVDKDDQNRKEKEAKLTKCKHCKNIFRRPEKSRNKKSFQFYCSSNCLISYRKKRKRFKKRKKFEKMWREGASLLKISNDLKVPKNTLRYWRLDLGLPPRDRKSNDRITKEMFQQFWEMWNQNIQGKKIAARLRVTEHTVSLWKETIRKWIEQSPLHMEKAQSKGFDPKNLWLWRKCVKRPPQL